ncbi:hypothetical protein HNR60_004173 [Rhodopseudomonas rhenobacensis]|uniref:Uncharacterized protein n=1 Tax=Rhodopseudomonas rhenobacensis TaxID=87461 RepID=A0A7W7Z7E3_9BRAD|nr:hypothetical protein [Rhodopseudomonas rhenobacensis]
MPVGAALFHAGVVLLIVALYADRDSVPRLVRGQKSRRA